MPPDPTWKDLHTALLEAFPTRDTLRELVRSHLGENLDAIASGETLRRRKSWEEEELTPQELQIALHVARGMTNREVGAALFLSHKTIEFHLGRIYRKLKMHSRAELIRRFARQAEEAEVLTA